MKNVRKREMRRFPRTFGRRDQGSVVSILALVIVVVLAASYGILEVTERRAHSAAEALVSQVVTHIDEKMDGVTDVTRAAALTAGGLLHDPNALEEATRNFVSRTAFVYGSTVAFEPDFFPERGRCFAPYSWKTSDGKVHSRQLGTETDYYQEEWYAETKRSGAEYWCEPYFDEGGAKTMMCTFSVPLQDEKGDLAAVLTADVGLEDLETYISSINPYPDSRIVLLSPKGYPLVQAEEDTEDNNTVIIRGKTKTGWSVELMLPFTFLMRGDTGILFFIGIILFITILLVIFFNRLLISMQQHSSKEYLDVIDAISTGFSSIYLLDLSTGETVTFRDPGGYEEIIGEQGKDHTGFTEKLKKLIEFDVSSSDQDMMLRETDAETIRKNLSVQERYQVRFRKEHDRGLVWHEMHGFCMERDEDGRPRRAVLAFTNVNESVMKEKKAQETLERALSTAQTASKAKTDFLFSMSHDIRTPLNAILGFTSMAKKHIDDREKVSDCLEKTQQSGNLLLALINSVLEVSRIESGHAKLEESTASVDLSFIAIENTLKDLAATKDISLNFSVRNIRDKYVYCDLDRCNRIFVNIISNAIKYTNEGGKVEITCEQIESDRPGYGLYRYTFADNGIGMSEDFQKHVFDQFSREETSTNSGVQGSGLGMAVCKSFVDLMGGTIECRSKLGEGTTFTVILPFRIQESERYIDPFTREEISAAGGGVVYRRVAFDGKKVLLVDDNELNREIAEEILEEGGFAVETAEDGSVAVRMLKEKGPEFYDFILMDIQMPVMNGYEATKAIRAMYPEKHITIIAVSANAFAEDRAASLAAGMDDHVAKPISIKELFTVLAKYA